MPQYKLTYFDLRARGEVVRMLFAAAGQDYEDKRVEYILVDELDRGPEFRELKPLTPFGQLPLLEVDGQVICQSRAISRYLARQFGLAGKSDWDRAKADMVVDTAEDLHDTSTWRAYLFADEEDKQKAMRALKDKVNTVLSRLESMLEESSSGYFVGDDMTWADIVVLCNTDAMGAMSLEVDAAMFPKCVALREKVQSHPKIAEWIQARPVTFV